MPERYTRSSNKWDGRKKKCITDTENKQFTEYSQGQALIQFRVDKDLKQDAVDICGELGTDLPTVFRMCVKQIKIARGIPFSTKLPDNVVTHSEALAAFEMMRKEAADVPELSLDEINEEIAVSRAERKERKAART